MQENELPLPPFEGSKTEKFKNFSKFLGHYSKKITQIGINVSTQIIKEAIKEIPKTQEPEKRVKLPLEEKMFLYERDNHTCQVCGKRAYFNDCVVAHNKAVSKGGKTIKSNIFIAHYYCNSTMGTRTLNQEHKRLGIKVPYSGW